MKDKCCYYYFYYVPFFYIDKFKPTMKGLQKNCEEFNGEISNYNRSIMGAMNVLNLPAVDGSKSVKQMERCFLSK